MMRKTVIWADGKKMVRIPAGSATIGSEKGYSDEKPVYHFETKAFYMDETPVTNAEFKVFCDATKRSYPPAPPWAGIKNYFTEYPDYPVVNVSYVECAAYAEWAKKRLPTEEEWEYAARGNKKGCDYPWGNAGVYEEDIPRANFADKRSMDQWCDHFADDGYRYTAPVGSYEKNGYGLYDMAGNVYQYVSGWYFSYADKVKSTEGFNDGWGGSRVCRGGSFHSPAFDIRVSKRHCILGGGQNETVGFRCVSDTGEIPADACPVFDTAEATEARPAISEDKFDSIAQACKGPGKETELCCGMNDANPETLKKLKALGFTSTERYVTWRSCEGKGKGIWDFTLWDKELENLKAAGLKWLPFIIAGPAYSLPDWYLRSDEHNGICCAEHGIESKIQSFWDKNFYKYIDRFLKKLSEHFPDHSVFEGLMFGISGDFGEAIVSVWHGNWPTISAGTYHAHSGYWCADRFAKADFIEKMKRKYKNDISKLNSAWGSNFKNFEIIEFPDMEVGIDRSRIDGFTDEGKLIVNSYSDRVRIVDFIDWYRQSMTDYVGYWMKTARKYFPDVKLYLCTGGEAQPCHASEFAAQSKICAKYDAGIRITNEDSNFEKNFCITNWVASACTFYGNDFSFEPAGGVTEKGIICRIYNASATGAKGLHFYSGNVLDNETHCRNFARDIHRFTKDKVKREIALFYPDTAIMFETTRRAAMYTTFSAMRDYSDYMYADDVTVADGILKGVKALVLTVGGYYRRKTLDKIMRFVREGGLLIGIGLDEILTIENNESVIGKLFEVSGERKIGHGKTFFINTELDKPLTDDETNGTVFDLLTDFLTQNGIYVSDGKRDRVYTSLKGDGLLVMNYDTEAKTKQLIMPDGTIETVTLDAATIEFVK